MSKRMTPAQFRRAVETQVKRVTEAREALAALADSIERYLECADTATEHFADGLSALQQIDGAKP